MEVNGLSENRKKQTPIDIYGLQLEIEMIFDFDFDGRF